MGADTPANEDKSPEQQLEDLLATAEPDEGAGTADADESQAADEEPDADADAKTDADDGEGDDASLDVETITDEQLAAIKDPAARKAWQNGRKGLHKRLEEVAARERGLEDRAAGIRWAERANQAFQDGKPEEAIAILRGRATEIARDANLQPAGASAQASGGIDAGKLRELYDNAPEDVRLLLDAMGAMSQQVAELGSTVQKQGSQLRTRDEQDAEAKIKGDLKELEDAYGDRFEVDERKLVAYCNEHGLVDLRAAFKAMHFDDAMNASKKAQAAARERKKKLPQDESSTAPSQPSPADTIEAIWEEAERGQRASP